LAQTREENGRKIILQVFPDRDLTFIKLLAQRLARQGPASISLLATTSDPPALVFAQSTGQPFDMGSLMKEILVKLGGRGGGSKDMAQGGPQQTVAIESELQALVLRIRSTT
jgi:alanyl-tRNA synthetase